MFPGLPILGKQCSLVCPPSENMARKRCFLVCPPSGNMARKQCFLVCQSLGNNVSWFVHLQETWLGNNVSWFVYRQETWLGNNVFWFVYLHNFCPECNGIFYFCFRKVLRVKVYYTFPLLVHQAESKSTLCCHFIRFIHTKLIKVGCS